MRLSIQRSGSIAQAGCRPAMTGLASYSYGIYMVHPIIAQVLRALIPDSMHLLRVASLNTVSILLFSLLAVFIIARIRPLRKWLLLIK